MCTTSVSPSFAVSRHSRLQPFDDRNSERQVAAYRAVETSKAKNCEFKRSLVKCMLLLHFMIVLFSKESVFRQKNRSNVQLLGAWRSPAVTARRSTRQHRISVLKEKSPSFNRIKINDSEQLSSWPCCFSRPCSLRL